MSTSIDQLVSGCREFLRDFPVFFETDFGVIDITTVRLPHPLVDATTMHVVSFSNTQTPTDVPPEKIQVDERNGLLKFVDASYSGKRVVANGYHFSWFLNGDLAFHSNRSLIDVSYGQDISSMDDFSPVEVDTIIMGTVVSALWSLATELALDIDVSTPEGMYIPARQRYAQVLQMWQQWYQQFHERMQNLNLGTGRLEQFYLRRVAKLTNRLVPLYKPREIDNPFPPQRIRPPIPSGQAVIDEGEDVVTQSEIGWGGQDIGWQTIGTSGAPTTGAP
jgi:hypothetical protein